MRSKYISIKFYVRNYNFDGTRHQKICVCLAKSCFKVVTKVNFSEDFQVTFGVTFQKKRNEIIAVSDGLYG